MTRSIHISYRDPATRSDTEIEIQNAYDLFGCYRPSLAFWSQPIIREVGITRLADLGTMDPIFFCGWEDMELLKSELLLWLNHLDRIDPNGGYPATWLPNLTYCYQLLIQSTPKEFDPMLSIG